MRKPELQAECRRCELDEPGTKKEMLHRLYVHFSHKVPHREDAQSRENRSLESENGTTVQKLLQDLEVFTSIDQIVTAGYTTIPKLR